MVVVGCRPSGPKDVNGMSVTDLKLAAEKGDPQAQTQLGVAYMQVTGFTFLCQSMS
jgi:hypothetical protein